MKNIIRHVVANNEVFNGTTSGNAMIYTTNDLSMQIGSMQITSNTTSFNSNSGFKKPCTTSKFLTVTGNLSNSFTPTYKTADFKSTIKTLPNTSSYTTEYQDLLIENRTYNIDAFQKTSSSEITMKETGIYNISIQWNFDTPTENYWYIELYKSRFNKTLSLTSTANYMGKDLFLEQNDKIKIKFRFVSSTATDLGSDIIITRIANTTPVRDNTVETFSEELQQQTGQLTLDGDYNQVANDPTFINALEQSIDEYMASQGYNTKTTVISISGSIIIDYNVVFLSSNVTEVEAYDTLANIDTTATFSEPFLETYQIGSVSNSMTSPEPSRTPTETVTGREYPPVALIKYNTDVTNASYGNGTYIVSASSEWVAYNYNAWKAFNKQTGYDQWWSSDVGTYSGASGENNNGVYIGNIVTTVNGVDLAGEWVQIQMPINIIVKRYQVAARNDGTYMLQNRNPASWWLVGSTDGITWSLVDTTNGYNWTTNIIEKTIPSNTNAYTYYRMIVKNIGNSGTFDHPLATVNEIYLFT